MCVHLVSFVHVESSVQAQFGIESIVMAMNRESEPIVGLPNPSSR